MGMSRVQWTSENPAVNKQDGSKTEREEAKGVQTQTNEGNMAVTAGVDV